jgi:hypothetical protein
MIIVKKHVDKSINTLINLNKIIKNN